MLMQQRWSFFLSFALIWQSWSLFAFQQTNDRRVTVRQTVTQLPAKNKRWALVIGIDKYKSGQIGRLRGAERDAQALRDALIQHAGFPEDQVILLSTAEAEDSPNQPRRIKILQYLSNLRGLVPPDGLLLVAFAGHGIERNGRAYLLPSDAEGTDDISLLEDSAISVETMKRRIKETGVRQVMFILDACRNDPLPGRADAANPMSEAFRSSFDYSKRNEEIEAFVTLYATSVGQRAYEYEREKQGYFTWALVQGLKGAAANPGGEVTLGSLKRYIEEKVPQYVQRDLGGNRLQRPFAIVEGYKADELVLAVSRPAPAVRMSVAGVPLSAMSFTTVNTDDSGNIINQRQEQCWGYVEDLGGGVKLELVEIPAGSFTMGSPSSEADRSEDEGPQHQVTVKGFLMGKTEVTQAQWRAVMGTNPSYFKGDDLPVEQVSWEDAKEFCRKLSARTGRNNRLPSEAEWEYAARGGTKTPFAFGATISPTVVNYDGDYPYGNAAKGLNRAKTVAAGSLPANEWGLHEMHGNVWEWCEDVTHENYAGAPSDGTAWLSGGHAVLRVLRGGSWSYIGLAACSAYRAWLTLDSRNNPTGFRVVAVARTR
jgi:formylglycine-generating enzyme required for sulfatase activity